MTPDADLSTNYHEALQLPPGSTAEQIHAQYRRLAKKYHPDRNPHRREWSEQQLRRLNEAYHALSAPVATNTGTQGTGAAPAPVSPALPHLWRRAVRYLAVAGIVCAAGVAYTDWSQSLPIRSSPDVSMAQTPQPPVAPAVSPGGTDQASLAAKFAEKNSGVDLLASRASQIVAHVNAEPLPASQSRRPQKAEQLAADVLELTRLQQSIRSGLVLLRTPTTDDLHRTQVADLQLALFQLDRQQRLVNAETVSFPAK